jgi:thiamine biosynthesis lipoprotein
MNTWRFEAIGTVWELDTAEPLSHTNQAAVATCIDSFDRDWSRFRADSLVSALAEFGGTTPMPDHGAEMFELYRQLSDATGAAVNPLVGESLVSLGYDANYTLEHGTALAAPANWQEALQWDAGELRLRQPTVIDVGAIGKGKLVDLVFAALAEFPGQVLVDAGGDLRIRGGQQRVGLEHPFDNSRAVGVVELSEGALCASASNRRAWGDGLHHVLDARTGEPVRTIVATWALAPTTMLADAGTTALFFDAGPEWAAAYGIEWARMTSAGAIEWSPAFPGELFS